ncbi:MAG: flagellar basal body rod protein FlgC [Pirellulaceae bacterium]
MSGPFSSIDISASGLAAERLRMEVVANNIANAGTTMTETGDPFRRQSVVFSSAMEQVAGATGNGQHYGVEAIGVEADQTEFPMVYNPGHPHADKDGFVKMPNVQISHEMVDLITASRSYEANTKAINLFKEMVEQTLSLLQGGR